MSSRVTIREATYADAVSFYGKPAMFSFRGFAAEIDGVVCGLGGVYRDNGRMVVFTEMGAAMRPHKKAIAKACRILMQFLNQLGGPVYAFASPTEPTSGYLLAKLGFKPTGEMGPYGDVLVRG